MNKRLRSRLKMFQSSLGVLDAAEHKPIWHQQPPKIFTKKVAAAQKSVAALETDGQTQGTKITGVKGDKTKEEEDLEEVCIKYGGTVAIWYRNHGDLTSAVQIDLEPNEWRRISEQDLVDKSRLLIGLTQKILDTATAEELDEWDITPAVVASLQKESDEFAAMLPAPQASIATRKGQTDALPDKFNAVEDQFKELDRFILHFGGTDQGDKMIAAFRAARNVIPRGKRRSGSSGTDSGPTPPA